MSFCKRYTVLFILIAIMLFLACRPGSLTLQNYLESGDKVIFSRGETEALITNKQLFEDLWGSDLFPRGGTLDTSQVRLLVDSLLMDTLVGIVADIDIKLEEHYHQQWSYRMRYQDALLGAYFNKYVYSQIETDSAMVRDHLMSNQEIFSLPAQVFFFHILVAPRWFHDGPDAEKYTSLTEEQLASEMEKYAYELYDAIVGGESFETIAFEFSHDKTTLREGGLVGWSIRERYPDPFDSIAFSAELGVVQPPYKDKDGWHIIKVVDKVDEGPLPIDRPDFFNRVKSDLVGRFSREISQVIIDSLREGLEIIYNDSAMELDVYRADVQTVAAIINGVDSIDFNELRNYELDYRRSHQVRNTTPEIKKLMIDRLANRYVILQAARAEKLDATPKIVELEYSLRHENTRSIVLSSRYDPGWRPTEAAIEEYYEANKSDFFIERPVRIQRMLFADSVLAEFIRAQAAAGVDLASLVDQYSSGDPSQKIELEEPVQIKKSDVALDVWLQAYHTPIGSVTDILAIDSSFQFIKVHDRKLSLNLKLANSKIMSILTKQYNYETIKGFTDSLKVRFEVTQPNKLTPIHLKPLIQRQNVVL